MLFRFYRFFQQFKFYRNESCKHTFEYKATALCVQEHWDNRSIIQIGSKCHKIGWTFDHKPRQATPISK